MGDIHMRSTLHPLPCGTSPSTSLPPRLVKLALVSALLATMAGCGGSDDNSSSAPPPPPPEPPTPAQVTLQGSAMRNAALQNAVVCMDLNANSACDAGEPTSAPTDASGVWSLSYETAQVSADKVAAASLIALVTPATTDAGRSGQSATTQPYVLRQVPGKSGQINPLTTLVAKGMTDGMTEAAARSNAATQLGIAEAKIDNYQDDPAAGPEQINDNARTMAAFTAGALEAGAVLKVGDPSVGQGATDEVLSILSYFDASNYFVATNIEQVRAAGNGKRTLTDQRRQVLMGAPTTNVRTLYPAIYLTPTGWKRCDASTLSPSTLGNPYRVTFCDAITSVVYETRTSIAGKTMAEVINTLQADPALNRINQNLTTAGLLAAVGTATFPAGAHLQKNTALALTQPLTIDNTSFRAIDPAQATTLEQLVAVRPASSVNLATSAGTLSLGLSSSTLRTLRVAFTGTTSATEGTVQYYDCDLNAANTVSSNCSATNTGTYHIDTVNGVRLMRFEGHAAAPAAQNINFYGETKSANGDAIYRVRQLKPTQALAFSADYRLDSTAWAALKAQLGL